MVCKPGSAAPERWIVEPPCAGRAPPQSSPGRPPFRFVSGLGRPAPGTPRMDTLYTLCRSADNHYAPPFAAEQVAEIISHKTTYFSHEAALNPLVREI